MKTLITFIRGKVRGIRGQRSHRKIVGNIFETRDALYASASGMREEEELNSGRIDKLFDRNDALRKSRRHATQVADRLTEFFTPR